MKQNSSAVPPGKEAGEQDLPQLSPQMPARGERGKEQGRGARAASLRGPADPRRGSAGAAWPRSMLVPRPRRTAHCGAAVTQATATARAGAHLSRAERTAPPERCPPLLAAPGKSRPPPALCALLSLTAGTRALPPPPPLGLAGLPALPPLLCLSRSPSSGKSCRVRAAGKRCCLCPCCLSRRCRLRGGAGRGGAAAGAANGAAGGRSAP